MAEHEEGQMALRDHDFINKQLRKLANIKLTHEEVVSTFGAPVPHHVVKTITGKVDRAMRLDHGVRFSAQIQRILMDQVQSWRHELRAQVREKQHGSRETTGDALLDRLPRRWSGRDDPAEVERYNDLREEVEESARQLARARAQLRSTEATLSAVDSLATACPDLVCDNDNDNDDSTASEMRSVDTQLAETISETNALLTQLTSALSRNKSILRKRKAPKISAKGSSLESAKGPAKRARKSIRDHQLLTNELFRQSQSSKE